MNVFSPNPERIHPLVSTHWYSPTGIHPLVFTHWYPPTGIHPLVFTHWYSPTGIHPLRSRWHERARASASIWMMCNEHRLVCMLLKGWCALWAVVRACKYSSTSTHSGQSFARASIPTPRRARGVSRKSTPLHSTDSRSRVPTAAPRGARPTPRLCMSSRPTDSR